MDGSAGSGVIAREGRRAVGQLRIKVGTLAGRVKQDRTAAVRFRPGGNLFRDRRTGRPHPAGGGFRSWPGAGGRDGVAVLSAWTVQRSTCNPQISVAYWRMVRSLEDLPMRATLRMERCSQAARLA